MAAHVLRARGAAGRSNDIYARLVTDPKANVVVFLGDTQHLREEMYAPSAAYPRRPRRILAF